MGDNGGVVLLDSVQLGTGDLAATTTAYETLLGVTPHGNAGTVRFQLGSGALELVAGGDGLRSITFTGATAATFDAHGVAVRVISGPEAAPATPAPDAVDAIDHVVVRSVNPERAIATWRDTHGLRLALDSEFPSRHLRLLFFRSNHITLEYATPLPPPDDRSAPDALFGITYRVTDLAARRACLVAAGVDVSEIRSGMRPGTVVATVRNGTAGVPTLLLGPAA